MCASHARAGRFANCKWAMFSLFGSALQSQAWVIHLPLNFVHDHNTIVHRIDAAGGCFGLEFLVELIEVSNGPVYLCREPFANHELVMFCNLRPVMRFLFINLAVIRCPFGCILSSFGAHSGLLVRSFVISLPAPDCPILARGPQSHVRSDPIGPRSGV